MPRCSTQVIPLCHAALHKLSPCATLYYTSYPPVPRCTTQIIPLCRTHHCTTTWLQYTRWHAYKMHTHFLNWHLCGYRNMLHPNMKRTWSVVTYRTGQMSRCSLLSVWHSDIKWINTESVWRYIYFYTSLNKLHEDHTFLLQLDKLRIRMRTQLLQVNSILLVQSRVLELQRVGRGYGSFLSATINRHCHSDAALPLDGLQR